MGLLQPVAMAVVPWTDIAIDFLTELPIVLGKSTVLVVVDRFFEMLRLIPFGEQTDIESVDRIFFGHVVHIHGLTGTIISDHDPRFVGQIWSGLVSAMGIKLLFPTVYYLQMDG